MKSALVILAIMFFAGAPGFTQAEGYVVYTRDGGAFRVDSFEVFGERLLIDLPGTLPNCWVGPGDIDRIEPWTGSNIASAIPVVFVPGSGSIFSFQGKYFGPGFMGAGNLSLVQAIVSSAPADAEIQRYAAEYRGRATVGQVFAWTGLGIIVGGFAYLGTFTPLPPNPSEQQEVELLGRDMAFLGLLLGGMFVWDFGARFAGRPTGIVNYYNEAYRAER